jgi:hypothetical protein
MGLALPLALLEKNNLKERERLEGLHEKKKWQT